MGMMWVSAGRRRRRGPVPLLSLATVALLSAGLSDNSSILAHLSGQIEPL
jgi:hypothetical protein